LPASVLALPSLWVRLAPRCLCHAAKTAVHRLRRRYGEILRAKVAETVASPEAVDEEIHHRFTVFG
jgi:hypothetical protein